MRNAFGKNIEKVSFELITAMVIALSPFYYLSIGGLGVYQILGLLQLLTVAVYMVSAKEIRIPIYAVWYAFFMVLIAVSNVFQGRNVIQAIKIYSIALMAMLFIKNIQKPINVYLFSSIISVCVGAYMLINNEVTFQGRLTITIGSIQQDPNWCALFFVIPFNYGLYSLHGNGAFKKIFMIAMAIMCMYITFLTGSRGAMLGLLVSALIWVIGQRKGRMRRMGILLISGLIFLLVFVEFIPTDMIDRMLANEKSNSRLTIWSSLLREYGNGNIIEMLFGRGDNSCHRVLGMGAHNDLLEVLFEFGILGLVCRIVFWIQIIRGTAKANNRMGVGILLALLTESMFSPLQGVIYFALAVAAVAYENKNKNLEAIRSVVLMLGGGRQ